jgi:hypothetical protein
MGLVEALCSFSGSGALYLYVHGTYSCGNMHIASARDRGKMKSSPIIVKEEAYPNTWSHQLRCGIRALWLVRFSCFRVLLSLGVRGNVTWLLIP